VKETLAVLVGHNAAQEIKCHTSADNPGRLDLSYHGVCPCADCFIICVFLVPEMSLEERIEQLRGDHKQTVVS